MNPPEHRIVKRFYVTALLSASYILVEALLKTFGKSICPTDGCNAVSSATRLGDWPFLILGTFAFATAAACARRLHKNGHEHAAQKFIDLVLFIALSVEGLLVTYQYIFLQAICLFCISVFILWLILFYMRNSNHWPQKQYQIKPAWMAASAIAVSITAFLLSPPPQNNRSLPAKEGLALFYNHQCPHCSNIISLMQSRGIRFEKYQYSDYAPTLKAAGITQVPTLFVTKDKKKIFITGETLISKYIQQQTSESDLAEYFPSPQANGNPRPLFLTTEQIRKATTQAKTIPEDICDGQSQKPCQ